MAGVDVGRPASSPLCAGQAHTLTANHTALLACGAADGATRRRVPEYDLLRRRYAGRRDRLRACQVAR
eukprot:scaffold131419_cov63-Phaeocystis_antarctica.AAC.3